MKRIVAFALVLCLLTGCSAASAGEDLMKDVNPSDQKQKTELITIGHDVPDTFDPETDESWDTMLIGDFGIRLLQAAMEEGKNVLISPTSVLSALAMTANGADGNTLAQMEAVLGQSVDALNSWCKYGVVKDNPLLHMANGIWFKDDPKLTVEESFLQTNADYYGAGIYKAPFDDTTLKDINQYAEENTDGMVKEILDKIPEEAVMYLVNALAFDGQWQESYKANQVHDAHFTTESGQQQEIELMYSEENLFLENDLATGFLKYYKDRTNRYAFAAVLPKEGVSVAELVQNLDGQSLRSLLANPQKVAVNAAIPKFQVEYDAQMSEILKAMGMTDAFDSQIADFSRLGTHTDGNIYISRVLHKTYICVAEKGTKAGAATVVEAARECALEIEIKNVVLNRPFVYMILDTESNTPVFIGTLMDMAQ